MKQRCPRCENTDLVVKKFTVGEAGTTVFDYFCPKCELLETSSCDAAGWEQALQRWHAAAEPQ